MIRVILPAPLCDLAKVDREISIYAQTPVTMSSVLDSIEKQYPMLTGTLRDQNNHERRPYVRFYANKMDISHESLEAPLPEAVTDGSEPLRIIGAMSGG